MKRLKVIPDKIDSNYIWQNLRKPIIQQLIHPYGYGLNPRILRSRQQFTNCIITTVTFNTYETNKIP